MGEVNPWPQEEGGGCRASIRVHSHVQTCMAACWAPHQRPSVGTGSPGRTALPSIRACRGIEAMTCLATPRHRVGDRYCITFSMKSFLETDPIPAAYSAISFSRAKASGPARPYVSPGKNASKSLRCGPRWLRGGSCGGGRCGCCCCCCAGCCCAAVRGSEDYAVCGGHAVGARSGWEGLVRAWVPWGLKVRPRRG